MIYSSAWWCIETAGWQVDESEESTVLLPCDLVSEAALVITAFRKAAGDITPEELWEMSGRASPPEAARTNVRCGDLEGYYAAYRDTEGVHWRVWWLARKHLHIYATFNCDPSDAGKHDAVLDWMLSTVRVLPAAG